MQRIVYQLLTILCLLAWTNGSLAQTGEHVYAVSDITDKSVIALQCRDTNGGSNYFFNGAATKSPTFSFANLFMVETQSNGQFKLRRLADDLYVGGNNANNAPVTMVGAASAATFTVVREDPTGWTTKTADTDQTKTLRFKLYGGNNLLNTQATGSVPIYYTGTGGYSIWYVYKYSAADIKQCFPTPTASLNGSRVTLTSSVAGAEIRYTTDGSEPTASSPLYTAPIAVGEGETIKAVALKDGYMSQSATADFSDYAFVATLEQLRQAITDGKNAVLVADIDASGHTTIENFSGTLDGNFQKITGLTSPLFGTATDAVIRNVILDNVSISGTTVGAIANIANGRTRIYNCGVLATNTAALQKGHYEEIYNKTFTSSSSISGTTAGSIVGEMQGNARVANCYSYADVSGSTYGAGIVGRATGTWSNNTNGTGNFIVNCMYYGEVTGGTKSAIVNATVGTTYSIYSYFRYKSFASVNGLTQNGAIAAAEDMWLKRFKFYQAGVTNHRDLAAVYCFGDAAAVSEIAQWHIDEDIAPWPILRRCEPRKSILSRAIPDTGNANEGNLVTNGRRLYDETTKELIDDDVTRRYNMSVGAGGYLTVNFTINGSSYSANLPITDMDYEHYDYTWGKVVLPFANEFDGWTRDYDYICTGWEVTSVSGGTAGTLTDFNYADRNCTAKDIYNADSNPIIFAQGGNYIVPYGVTSINVKAHFAKAYYLSDNTYDSDATGVNIYGGSRPTTYHGRTVYTSVAGAWGAMQTKTLPHDQAIVLVGNYHYSGNTSGSYTGKGCTIISVDDDCDQQPDYGWYSSSGAYRTDWMPIRWDFVPIVGAGMLQIYDYMRPGLAIPCATGWFELTETILCRTFEFEISDAGFSNSNFNSGVNAYILNGGWFQQLVRIRFNGGTCNKLSYLKIGGNAYIREHFHGNHSNTSYSYTMRPVIMTGGEVHYNYMTGMGNKNVVTTTGDANGQNVRFYCSGGKTDKYLSIYMGYPVANATIKADHAKINKFFGGGTSPKARVQGNISIQMDNSTVNFFCGGPEFGDMYAGKTVTVTASGSIFKEYYGAGFGGSGLTRRRNGEGGIMANIDNYSLRRLQYSDANGGIDVQYEMEALLNGSGDPLYRFYDYAADFSFATAGNTSSTMTKCLFRNNFYGGGCQGKVDGTVTSVLNNCDVKGTAFGGGYKAANNTVEVYPAGGATYPTFNTTYKAFTEAVYPASELFTWKQGTKGTSDDGKRELYTDADMTQMGNVTGNISLTINGGTIGVNAFGGGNESPSLKNTTLTITDGTVLGGMYGGGALANVSGSTEVNLAGGTVKDVFGGGLGQQEVRDAEGNITQQGIAALVGGDTTVKLNEAAANCTVTGSIFGCNNLNGTPQGTPTVHIFKTKSQGEGEGAPKYHVKEVYGGGNLAAYIPGAANLATAKAKVIVYDCSCSIDYVYGGGNAAPAPATDVTIWGGNEINNAFGGGNGAGASNPGANIGYNNTNNDTSNPYGLGTADLKIYGGTVNSVFGGSNTKGLIRESASITIDEKKLSDDVDQCPLKIGEVYSAGNEADMYCAGLMKLGCISYMKSIFGGAKNANVGSATSPVDIQLTIAGGTFDKVFGGNNLGGTLHGFITVNIDETGCNPVVIGELYGGGYNAAYTTPAKPAAGNIWHEGEPDADPNRFKNGATWHEPVVNVYSCTSIGSVFGGGLGAGAVVTGNPVVNILQIPGRYIPGTHDETNKESANRILGKIGNVYGGGNAAKVNGATTVNIATQTAQQKHLNADEADAHDKNAYNVGANISGNVYGGGNEADVTGKTNVTVGRPD